MNRARLYLKKEKNQNHNTTKKNPKPTKLLFQLESSANKNRSSEQQKSHQIVDLPQENHKNVRLPISKVTISEISYFIQDVPVTNSVDFFYYHYYAFDDGLRKKAGFYSHLTKESSNLLSTVP